MVMRRELPQQILTAYKNSAKKLNTSSFLAALKTLQSLHKEMPSWEMPHHLKYISWYQLKIYFMNMLPSLKNFLVKVHLVPMHALWKLQKSQRIYFHLTSKIFSRNIFQVRIKHSTVWRLRNFTLTHFWQNFRESNGFTKELTKLLIWRIIFSVRVNFSPNNLLIWRNRFEIFLFVTNTQVASPIMTWWHCLIERRPLWP